MERSGRRRLLFRRECITNAQPREREFHGGHRGAESLGGGALPMRDGLLRLKRIGEFVERSLMLVTALSPVIGYDKASKIAHVATA
jgi:hypothetical protein